MRSQPAIPPNEIKSTSALPPNSAPARIFKSINAGLRARAGAGMRKCLITRNIRIDLFGPRIDAAGYIRDFRKSRRAQKFLSPPPPHSAMAKPDALLRAIQFTATRREFA